MLGDDVAVGLAAPAAGLCEVTGRGPAVVRGIVRPLPLREAVHRDEAVLVPDPRAFVAAPDAGHDLSARRIRRRLAPVLVHDSGPLEAIAVRTPPLVAACTCAPARQKKPDPFAKVPIQPDGLEGAHSAR